MHTAQANAETAQVPIVQVPEPASKLRRHAGLKAAAGIVVIGAAALTIGVVSSQGGSQQTALADGTVRSIAIEGSTGRLMRTQNY